MKWQNRIPWIVLLAASIFSVLPGLGDEPTSAPIEEWQIRGIWTALNDGDVQVKWLALKRLRYLLDNERAENSGEKVMAVPGAEDAVAQIVSVLGDSSASGLDIRQTALEVLGALRATDSIPSIAQLLKDPDRDVRLSAAEAIGHIGGSVATRYVTSLLGDEEAYVRAAAVTALGTMGAEETLPGIRPLLMDSDSKVRAAVIEAYAAMGAEEQVPDLLPLLKDRDAVVRLAAVRALEVLRVDEAVPDIVWELQDSNGPVRAAAVRALGNLGASDAVPDIVLRLKDADREVRAAVVEALGTLGLRDSWRNVIGTLTYPDEGVRKAAVAALAVAGGGEAIPDVRRYLESDVPFLVKTSIEALAAMGAEDAIVDITAFLDSSDENVRLAAVEALGVLGAAAAAPQITALLDDDDYNVRRVAIGTLGVLGAKDAIPEITALLADDDYNVREAAVGTLGVLGAKDAIPEITALLADDDYRVREAAAEALRVLEADESVQEISFALQNGRLWASGAAALSELGSIEDIPAIVGGINTIVWSSDHEQTAQRAIDRMSPLDMQLNLATLVSIADMIYEEHSQIASGRFFQYYLTGGDAEARLILQYLCSPDVEPVLPLDRQEGRYVVSTLLRFSSESKSQALRGEAVEWMAIVITQQVHDWDSSDVPLLRSVLTQLESDWNPVRTRALVPAIQEVIEPFEIRPSRQVRALLAFALINFLAVLLFVVARGRVSAASYFVYALAGGVSLSQITEVGSRLHIDLYVFLPLLLVEVVCLLGAGTISPTVLRQVAKLGILNRIAVPLAVSIPWSRRRIFDDYVVRLRSQLERDRRNANNENYLQLPSTISAHDLDQAEVNRNPADTILNFISNAGHVLIEAPGGRGKSALIREVARRLLDMFIQEPSKHRLPVLLPNHGNTLLEMTEEALGSSLLAPELVTLHFENGHLALLLDGASESSLSPKELKNHLSGPYAGTCPILVGARPVETYQYVIQGARKWLVVEPQRLNESQLSGFVRHYGGRDLTSALKEVCRNSDGTYLPLLVRMAMVLSDEYEGVGSTADLYRAYYLKLFENELPDEQDRFDSLRAAAKWCLDTYWVTGSRISRYEGTELQQKLVKAGVLLPADSHRPPKSVQFFHDSMQSYLTALGLAHQDDCGYSMMPILPDWPRGSSWNRRKVLLRVAGESVFLSAQSESGSELFQMCLTAFDVGNAMSMREWLNDELLKWVPEHSENLRRKDLLSAVPGRFRNEISRIRGVESVFRRTIEMCFSIDSSNDSVDTLGEFYARIAPYLYELERGLDNVPASAPNP